MKRNKFSLSQYKLLTGDLGQLLPTSVTEVLPGDSIKGNTSVLLRTVPPMAPLMHPVKVRIHHWFVPARLVFEDWEPFITGGNNGLGDGSVYPTITAGGSGFDKNKLPDYLGVPTDKANLEIAAMPIRVYNKIFNEFYRDQDMVTEVTEDSLDIQRCAWEKDYFTAARPWPQRGPAVTLPLGTEAPIYGTNTFDDSGNAANQTQVLDGPAGSLKRLDTSSTYLGGASTDSGDTGQLFADLSAATAASVDDIREAFALQRYQEARGRFGARYTEYLRYMGVISADSRLQRPEFLGGGSQTISFSEILTTTGYDTTAADNELGQMGGHGIAAVGTRHFVRHFTEHGYVMTLMSARPKSMYNDGLFRHWNRRTKEDYWQKELQHIGQQEVQNKEIYADGTSADDNVFGYNDRYSEYRKAQSTIAAEFRTNYYNFWHMARMFGSLPTLNQDFTDCDPGKRFFTEQTQHSLLCMAQNNLKARRLVAHTQQNRIY